MNDKDQDRCGDSAGPSANDDAGPHERNKAKAILFALIVVCVPLSLLAQTARGLSLSINAGTLFADDYHAAFYSGIPTNANTVERLLHSQQYGEQMWTDLASQGLISSSIGNYRQLTVAEYGQMHYRLSMQLGVGFRYDFGRNWAWLVRFDYAKLNAVGQFLLNSGRNNSTTLTNQDAYVACPVVGSEKRIVIDLALSHRFPLNDRAFLQADLGASLNNTKVLANDIQVAGRAYSILDVWRGQSPDYGMQGYDYINQGGMGDGGFFTIGYGLDLGHGNSALLHYTLYYTQTNLQHYALFTPQNLIGLRFELGNFSFLR